METRRQSYQCPIFGSVEDIKDNLLPTYEDVMKCYEWNRLQLKISRNTIKEPSFLDIAELVSQKVEDVWRKSSLPTVSHTRVIQLLKAYHLKCKNLIKSLKRLSADQKNDFIQHSRVLFDICSCKCKQIQLCCCPRENKVPKEEQQFLLDQRQERKMRIGGIDRILTNKLQKKVTRASKTKKSSLNINKNQEKCNTEQQELVSSSSESEGSISSPDRLNLPSTSQTKKKTTKSVKSLPMLSKTCDRYGISDRAAAAIVSSVLHDVSSDIEVIDKSKIRRERKKERNELYKQQTQLHLPALYFDGRKDKTLNIVKKGAKRYRQTVIEEHITVVKEPDSVYIGYATPIQGTAKSIEASINALLLSKKIKLDNLMALGCDGTVTNTGKFSGVIRLFEKRLQRPLQWIICMLHLNELPLRHLFNKLDGVTTGPSSHAGLIGKSLENCEKLPITSYEKIQSELPEVKFEDLSTDQKYLYEITMSVISGKCSDDLTNRSPGKMSHARWLTKANRILRLYISTSNPSNNLKLLAEYCVKVYAPIWFQIKTNPTCKDGSKNLWKLIKNSRYLPAEFKLIIDPVIQRNAYFAHPENLLLSMLSDKNKTVRELAAKRILKARNSPHTGNLPRVFEVPQINFDANEYIDLIDWQQNFFDPPILRHITNKGINEVIESQGDENLIFLKLPCHTQAVERSVKIVTEASMSLCDKNSREGLIQAKLASRKLMPRFDSKRDFVAKT